MTALRTVRCLADAKSAKTVEQAHQERMKMAVDRAQIDADRAVLRKRWIEEGFFTGETLSQAIDAAVVRKPDTRHHFYSEHGYQTATIAEINAQAWKLARALARAGIRKGDVIAVQMPMVPEVVPVQLAIAHLGAVALPIVHTYGPADLTTILTAGRVRMLIIPDAWRGIDFADRLAAATLPQSLDTVLVIGNGGTFTPRTLRYGDLLASGDDCEDDGLILAGDPQDDSLILFSSGTTGAPKGIRHSNESILAEYTVPFLANDGPYFTMMPPGHIAALVVIFHSILKGVEMVTADRWDAALAAEVCERHRVTQTGGVPLMLIGLLEAAKQDGRDLSSIVSYRMSGTAVTPHHIRMASDAGFLAGRFYGLSEHPTVSVVNDDGSFAQRSTTDGVPSEGTEIRIVDDNGNDVPTGTDGEIATRGPELFIGYTDPSLELTSFLPGGWFLTGDIGHLDEDGAITITDRKKDIIIRGGENISPKEIEDLLLDHSAIREVAVVAFPDERLGERACAVIVLEAGQTLTLAEVIAHLSAKDTAKLKWPERLECVEAMPLTANGKVRKDVLRARLRAETAPA
ncbi:AMP-binding protein [uncultured Novosphingobium sp.]|uniref:AMP-binding protein n=1 Tax=uncultured Novosphingobium sp. TaxID=292277 RepID=UPI00258795A3|nr:AMP-binding protein [uncultured Novosphingobium sp.]